jgi:hypothetical protein
MEHKGYLYKCRTYGTVLLPSTMVNQCCGYGSGIRCLFDPWIPDQGRVKNQDSDPDEQPGSYFRERRNSFLS